MSTRSISSALGTIERQTEIKACGAVGLLSPRRSPPIRCIIARPPGHNLTIQMSYTLSEERATSADTFFLGISLSPTKIGGSDNHSLLLALFRIKGHKSTGQRWQLSSRTGRDEAVLYCPIAALNFTTSSAGTRPRSLTSMPWDLAHSRTAVESVPLALAGLRPL